MQCTYSTDLGCLLKKSQGFTYPRKYQRYTYRVLQTIQMKLTLLCVWAERALLGSAKTALEFKYKI